MFDHFIKLEIAEPFEPRRKRELSSEIKHPDQAMARGRNAKSQPRGTTPRRCRFRRSHICDRLSVRGRDGTLQAVGDWRRHRLPEWSERRRNRGTSAPARRFVIPRNCFGSGTDTRHRSVGVMFIAGNDFGYEPASSRAARVASYPVSIFGHDFK